MNTQQKINLLQRLLDKSSEITVRDSDNPVFKAWKDTVERTLIRVFGDDSTEVNHFRKLRFFFHAPIMVVGGDYSKDDLEAFDRDLEELLSSIRNYIEELTLHADQEAAVPARQPPDGNNVFIIHGRDLDFAEAIARLVDNRGLKAIILEEKANKGRTIIEKFEQHALPCAFAIAILTGDDEGRLRGSEDQWRLRARQNVVLELGYFMAALGRSRIAVVHEPAVEMPSNFDGVVYISKDADWKSKLSVELDAAKVGNAEVSVVE